MFINKAFKESQMQGSMPFNNLPCRGHTWRPYLDGKFYPDKNIGEMPEEACLRCTQCRLTPGEVLEK